ncbi:MAG TPA: hypothetical protein VFP98_10290, partial [Candidatus Polarisedimenticolia bacterium]|nr:hypothetical protein [Candidatus Polarisedimenticolia bacterium]
LFPLIPALAALLRVEPLPYALVWRNLRLVLPALASFILVAAHMLLARSDDVFRRNAAGYFDWTVHYSIWWYPITYGILFVFAIIGVRRAASQGGVRNDLLLAWLAAACWLSTNPVMSGVKFQYLVFPAMALLAAIGLTYTRSQHAMKRRAAPSSVVVALVLLGLFIDSPAMLARTFAGGSADREAYAPAGLLDALRWLDGQPAGTVLCSYRTGRLVPWLAGKRAYTGHWFMTLDVGPKTGEAQAFFDPAAPAEFRSQVLARSSARYIVHGPWEPGASPAASALPFERIYEKDGVSIYRVDPAP